MKVRDICIIVVLVVAVSCQVQATTRYVSKMGSGTPPYTTWETAAPRPALAARVAQPNDTIRLSAGEFVERDSIVLNFGMCLLGAGWDSTTIRIGTTNGFQLWSDSGSITVSGVNFQRTDGLPLAGTIFKASDHHDTLFIEGCRFDSYEWVVYSSAYHNVIQGCLFYNCARSEGPIVDIGIGGSSLLFENNTIEGFHYRQYYSIGVRLYWMLWGGNATIRNNIFRGMQSDIQNMSLPGWMIVENNLFLDNMVPPSDPDAYSSEYILSNGPHVRIQNNLFEGSDEHSWMSLIWLGLYEEAYIRNNIFIGSQSPVNIDFERSWPGPFRLEINYNDFYLDLVRPSVLFAQGLVVFDSVFTLPYFVNAPSDTQIIDQNIFQDPMFADTISYQLQQGSPCIDAGHPGIFDLDGSRSDIGPLGGQGGEFYVYQDFPPATPQNFGGNGGTTSATVLWQKNSESDLRHYILFRSQSSPVPLDSGHVRAYFHVGDSGINKLTYLDTLPITFRDTEVVAQQNYFYVLVAVDSSLLVSQPTAELQFLVTDVADPGLAELPVSIDLEQNYPNPFNATTALVYSLPNIGAQPATVRLVIYNSLGQRVTTLIDDRQFPGRHVVTWDGDDDSGQPVASGVYFYRLEVSGIDFVKNRKMVLMK